MPATVRETLPDLPAARPRRAPRPPERGLIVRRRWTRLRAGAGWTWTGITIVLVCWGIWAVSIRGTDMVAPTLGLGLVLSVGAFLFVLARLVGRVVLEQALGRDRTSAWPSHLTVCLFLTLAAVAFLQQTQWITDSWRWFGDSWQWLVNTWDWLTGWWPW